MSDGLFYLRGEKSEVGRETGQCELNRASIDQNPDSTRMLWQ